LMTLTYMTRMSSVWPSRRGLAPEVRSIRYLERRLPTTALKRTKPSGNLYSDQNAPMAESIGAFRQTMKLVQEQENFLFGLGHLGAKNERRPWDAISCERSAETAMQINYSTVKLYVAPHSVTEQESLRKSNPGPQSRGTSADWPLRAIGIWHNVQGWSRRRFKEDEIAPRLADGEWHPAARRMRWGLTSQCLSCVPTRMDDDGVRGRAMEYPAAFPNPSNEAQKIGVHLDSTPDVVAPASPARLRGNNHPPNQGRDGIFAVGDFKCAAYVHMVHFLCRCCENKSCSLLGSPYLQSPDGLRRVRVVVVRLN
jgi:hypothetical protein